MTLDIDLTDKDLQLIKRKKGRLIKSFNAKTENDIEEAIELANYLVALGEYRQAQHLLESFIYTDPKVEKGELWVINGQGVVLLAYICRMTNKFDSYRKYITALEKNDLWPTDISQISWVRMHIKDYKKVVNHALGETQKYKCMYIGQQVLSFMYFYEMLFIHNKPSLVEKLFLKDVVRIFFDSSALLFEALTSEK